MPVYTTIWPLIWTIYVVIVGDWMIATFTSLKDFIIILREKVHSMDWNIMQQWDLFYARNLMQVVVCQNPCQWNNFPLKGSFVHYHDKMINTSKIVDLNKGVNQLLLPVVLAYYTKTLANRWIPGRAVVQLHHCLKTCSGKYMCSYLQLEASLRAKTSLWRHHSQ